MRNRLLASENGFAFVSIAILSFILFGLSLSYFDLIVSEKRMIRATENSVSAEAIAEAGIEEALWEYNYGDGDFTAGDGWSGTTTKSKTVNAFTNASGNTIGSYTTTITAWDTDPKITVTGTVTAAGTNTQATLKSNLDPRAIFSAAVKVQNLITMSGNGVTDSYDSSTGAYGGANIKLNGDSVTNSNAIPAITLGGNARIKGDAATGTSGTVSLTGNAVVSGTTSNAANESFTAVTVPSTLTALSSLGTLSSGTLNAGDYKYTDITVTDNDSLTINGAVRLYLTSTGTALDLSGNAEVIIGPGGSLDLYSEGNVSITGNGTINDGGSQNVSAVEFYGTSTCTSFVMSGNGVLDGVVYAPAADVNISGNGTLYGGVVGNSFTSSGNGGLHYDEQLATSGPSSGYKLEWYRRI